MNLVQELTSVDHNPLFLVFLDLRKAYDTVDRDRLIQTLEGYGTGPHIFGLLETFWSHQQVFPKHNLYHRSAFPATWVKTQGGLVSPTLFNLVVDYVIRKLLTMTVGYHSVDHNGLGEAFGRCLGVFYTDYVMVGSRDPDWLQHLMNVLVGLFWWYGRADNIAKSCLVTCQPGALSSGIFVEAKYLKCTGVVTAYRMKLRQLIPCPGYGVDLTTGSMIAHCLRMHGTEPVIEWNRLSVSHTEHHPQVYDARFLWSTNQCSCLFPSFPGSSHTWNGLQFHYNNQHW